MSKLVSFGKNAMEKMLCGLDTAADAVSGTIGPKGRNVYLQEIYGNKIVNDGVTIASKVVLKDPEEDMGAFVIRNATSQTNDDVGDGTTTTAILTQAIIHECLARPENPMEIRTSLNDAAETVYAQLKSQSVPITTEDIERVALISAEDPTIAHIISEVTQKLGVKAVINVEDAKTLETDYEIVDGYEAPVGFLSPYFSDPKTGKAVLTDVPVLVTDKKISNVIDIKPLFDQFAKESIGSCVIVCDDIENSMLGVLVTNKLQGRFNPLVIKAHGDILKDIEGATGATMVSDSTGVTFQSITTGQLGFAKSVISDQHKTLFLGDGIASKEYADVLERQVDTEPNQYIKKKIEERVAQLRGGIAVIRIAAPTDLEREYLKLKAEDAIKAVQAALEEGIVTGGGLALWDIAQNISTDTVGGIVLKKSLIAPARKIIENGGQDYTEIMSKPDDYKLSLKDVSDPTKVERIALQNAVSAAGALITSFALITDIPDATHDK